MSISPANRSRQQIRYSSRIPTWATSAITNLCCINKWASSASFASGSWNESSHSRQLKRTRFPLTLPFSAAGDEKFRGPTMDEDILSELLITLVECEMQS